VAGWPQGTEAAPVPVQLPPARAAFAGRDAELAGLDAMLPAADQRTTGTGAVIAAITGTAGVVKTALALHWRTGTRALPRWAAVRRPARIRPDQARHGPRPGAALVL
jgi:hypothetical protein